jgi:hypothetical protein
MTHRTRLLTVVAAVAVAVAVVVALIVIDPFSSSLNSSAPSSGATSARPSATLPATTSGRPGQAPVAPAHGAYFGAWVGPAVYTQANEISAVDLLQQQVDRKLNIVHTYLKWQAPFPTASAQAFLNQGSMLLISWAGTNTKQIVSGADDGWIRTRADQIKALGKPVFLEWRWEMDRPNLRTEEVSGADFVAAWDHIRSIFASAGVHNAAWVWCPTAEGFADGQAPAFYPGDHEVDWVCADAYPQQGSHVTFASTVTPFLGWASHHGKPVMIGEFGVPRSYSPSQRAQWLRAAGQVIRAHPQIKAMLYFDSNPAGRGPAGSYSLNGDASALSAFRAIAQQPYFNP